MRVLIIGSSGSIGKHLTSFLNSSKKIKEVYAIDKKKDKQISKKVKFKKLDLEYLKSDTKFSKKIDCAIIFITPYSFCIKPSTRSNLANKISLWNLL